MKRVFYLIGFIIIHMVVYAQQDISSFYTQQQLEEMVQKTDLENEDDQFVQRLQYLSKHPLNLNSAGREDLHELGMLDDIQINQFLSYRHLLGKLLSVYELQAVPGWNLKTIQTVLPYITLSDAVTVKEDIRNRLKKGEHSLLLRTARTPEKAAGYQHAPDSIRRYPGSPSKLYLRYQYKYKNLLQFGALGEKDAGEQFFKGRQKSGFDFYSGHLFIRKLGAIRELAIGDYSVSMGQGLIQWQGLALGAAFGLAAVERQSPVLRPYSSSGEVDFYRGAGITVEKSKWTFTSFFSSRRISANTETDASGQLSITSLLQSGYHRTVNEQQNRNNISQSTAGGVFSYSNNGLHLALHAVHHSFSVPFHKDDDPYNLFAARGKRFTNASVSYRYTYRNVHVFGEWAADKKMHKAMVNGLLLSLHSRIDLAVVQRSIAPDYQSLYASAFTQNSSPVNETGLYTGLTLRPSDLFTIDASADLFRFPWLKYRVDAPSYGKEYSLQATYKPSKLVEITSRYRLSYKPLNRTGTDSVMSAVQMVQRANWRVHINMVISRAVTLHYRCEISWYNKKQLDQEEGYLAFTELSYKSSSLPFSGSARLQYFETDGYNSRLYAHENSVMYGFSIPAFFDKGWRYYCNIHADLSGYLRSKTNLHINCWLRWAQSVYPGKKAIGEGTDQINGNRKSELTLQIILHK